MKDRPTPNKDFGLFLRGIRERAGLGQRQAAARASMLKLYPLKNATLNWLESGRIKNPDADLLRALAVLYGEPYEEIVRRLVTSVYGVGHKSTDSDLPSQSHEASSPSNALSGGLDVLTASSRLLEYQAAGRAVADRLLEIQVDISKALAAMSDAGLVDAGESEKQSGNAPARSARARRMDRPARARAARR